EEANAYKAEIVERAKGQANRFERLYVEYKMAPEVTRRRMYIDTMENVLSNTSKILVDVEGGNNLMY
ncbi:MAG TPA: protease modulator HflK, partial [Gammaproteobacteria bacterium]|nr:protease modulator HflK [Gammaproteobacteria bacterium]